MSNEIAHLVNLLERNEQSGGWHGPAIMEVLDKVDAATAFAHPLSNCHSIWELVEHIIAWRIFVLEQLKGNSKFTIAIDGDVDWKTIEKPDEMAWRDCLERLGETSMQLKSAIGTLSEESLNDMVPNKPFPYFALLHGVLHHDIYHTAQISLLKKLSASMQT